MKKVFLCEDDEDIQGLIKLLITDMGYRVSESELDIDKILTTLRQERPALIILDYWLGKISTEELVGRIKSDDELSNIPIILISAITNLEDIAKKLKVDGIIKKPFDIEQFSNTVNSLLL